TSPTGNITSPTGITSERDRRRAIAASLRPPTPTASTAELSLRPAAETMDLTPGRRDLTPMGNRAGQNRFLERRRREAAENKLIKETGGFRNLFDQHAMNPRMNQEQWTSLAPRYKHKRGTEGFLPNAAKMNAWQAPQGADVRVQSTTQVANDELVSD